MKYESTLEVESARSFRSHSRTALAEADSDGSAESEFTQQFSDDSLADSAGSTATQELATRQVEVARLLPEGVPGGWADRAKRKEKRFPQPGEAFLDFDLLRELGRGSFGRVYLAKQRSLAGRMVAVKVFAGATEEMQTLARMQHAYIMPIYSTLSSDDLQVVVMPYFGSTTLADVCTALERRDSTPHSVQYLVETLATRRRKIEQSLAETLGPGALADEAQASRGEILLPGWGGEGGSPAADRVGGLSYVGGILLLVQRIAEGLAHAHERGIVHRDLKPANILLTDDGQPMILDFNLAHDASAAKAAVAGGTVPYMSPEQLAAFSGGGEAKHPVDARTDIYSLGLILHELLTRKRCFGVPPGSLRDALPAMLAERRSKPVRFPERSPHLTPAVEAIVRKCLKPNAADRYPTARALAEDIERHRGDLPLKHAAEPSSRERFRKWCRRNPRLVSPPALGGAAASVSLLAIGLVAKVNYDGREAVRARDREAGREILRAFDADSGRARQLYAARTDEANWNGDGLRTGLAALEGVGAFRGDNWLDRPEFAHLAPDERGHLKERAGELAVLMSMPDASPAAKSAGESALRDRLHGLPLLDEKGPFLRAAEMQAQRKYRESLALLEPLERAQPDVPEYQFLIGRARQMTGDMAKAHQHYSVCIALKPNFGPAYYNRAQVGFELNAPQVDGDVEKAVALEPDNREVRYLQARWLAKLRRLPEAREALNVVCRQADAPARSFFLRARIDDLMGDRAAGQRDRERGLAIPPADSRDYVLRGLTRQAAEPAAALADFEAAERLAPEAIDPLQNQIHVEGELLGNADRALVLLDRLLERNPDFRDGREVRAVFLARMGRADQALAEVAKLLAGSQGRGTHYQVACTYALLAKANPEYAAPALRHLAISLENGFGFNYVPTDTDLDAIRARPEFETFAAFVRTSRQLQKKSD